MKKLLFFILICFWITAGLHAQVGKVGINTTTPSAMLHVKDSSVLFSGTSLLPMAPGLPPDSGPGTRMMWYPDKAAFRAGNLTGSGGTFWDRDSIGNYSIAFGSNTRASGPYSIAQGSSTRAIGYASIAMGSGTFASNNSSTAMGLGTHAIALASTSMGAYTTASGSYATAMGFNTTASANYAVAMGYYSIASGAYSIASGQNSIASGEFSTAMGSGTSASAGYSTALGWNSSASGGVSTAMGSGTSASGNYSTTMGASTSASGNYSTAMGLGTIAKGDAAIAAGLSTIAKSFMSMVIGRYNDTTSISSNSWNVSDPIFIVGNGSAFDDRNNAMTVLKNGKTGINTHSPEAMLHVIRDTPTGGPYNANAAAIFEGDQGSFIQLSNNNTIQSGILSGNEVTSLRSGLIFTPDSSVQIRAGGNTTKLFVRHDGNTGIGTLSPQKLFHVSAGPSGATATSSAVAILEDNGDVSLNLLSPSAESSAIYFGNPDNAVHGGIVYNSPSSNGLGFRTNGNITRAVITDTGDMGIGDNSPNARLHVSKGASGASYNGSALLLIEDDASSYLQFANPAVSESGILSGTESISLRSAVIFRPDSSVQIRAGGSTTRLVVTKNGNTGIGTLSPAAKLDVNGTTILGVNGTALTEIIKITVTKDVASVPANSTGTETFAVANSATTSTVYISPASALSNGLIIAYARVSVAGTVEVKFTNTTGSAINPASMDYHITVIR